jgi:hypothetical protein
MVNISAPDLTYKSQHTHTYGNLSVAHASFIPSPQPNTGDVIRMLRLSANVKLLDCLIIFSEGAGTNTDLDLGYTHVDGSGGDNPDYFLDLADIDAATFFRALAMPAIETTTKDVYITGTVITADWDADAQIDIWVNYEFVGHG